MHQRAIMVFPDWHFGRDRHPLRTFLHTAWNLLGEGLTAFVDDHALTRGAAIAFYAVTALAPVLFIATGVASLAFGQDAASGAIGHQLRHLMSKESANLLQLAIMHVRQSTHTMLGSLIGGIALIFTASGVFTEMEDSLNVIWKAPRTESYFYQVLRGRIMGLGLVVLLGLLLMISMIVASGIGVLGHFLDRTTSLSGFVIAVINIALTVTLVSALFAVIYKVLPNKPLQWRDVLVGAFGTAVLFELGQALIGLYLANFISASVYGVAGGVMVLLVWAYYSAQVFLLGAEFTKVWANHYGSQRER
ncbi:MAG TPA: YihY/virulence factor BrkB family protein [Rhizomicrobium sp.]|nr:YihY/virulence factor BrkB family protein [Rhizomicrobium sp.]